MAIITSAGSGNFGSGSTWIGGIVPGVNDDIVISSGHIINANVDFTVLSITRNANVGHIAVSTSRNITCTGSGIIATGTNAGSGIINVTATSGATVNITANILNNGGSGGNQCITVNGTATINIIGNVTGNGQFNSHAINILAANSVVNITGNILGSSMGNAWAVQINGANSNLSVTGNVTAGTVLAAIISSVTSTININGGVFGNASVHAVTSSTIVRVGGAISNAGGRLAISSPLVALLSSINTQWIFQTENALNNKTLYDAGGVGYPAESQVQTGVIYGPNLEFTGNLPASLTPADFWNYLTANPAAAGSILEAINAIKERTDRIPDNPASIETTGAAIAAAVS